MLVAAARDEEHLALLRELGFTSAIVVPMIARGKTLGAISLISAESGRKYDEADLDLANELALRAALAVDNARLYEEAQTEIAEREWAQTELRSSRDELRVILESVADGVTAQDPTGRIIYANEAAARMIGYSSGQALVEASQRELMERFEVFDEEGRPFPLEKLPGAGRSQARKEPMRSYVSASLRRVRAVVHRQGGACSRRPGEGPHGGQHLSRHNRAQAHRRDPAGYQGLRAQANSVTCTTASCRTSYTAAAMGLIMLEVEGTDLEGELRSTTDAVRRAAQGLRDAVNDLRLEEERDRPFPELVKSLVRRNRARTPDCEITLEVEDGFPSTSLGETGRSWRA